MLKTIFNKHSARRVSRIALQVPLNVNFCVCVINILHFFHVKLISFLRDFFKRPRDVIGRNVNSVNK